MTDYLIGIDHAYGPDKGVRLTYHFEDGKVVIDKIEDLEDKPSNHKPVVESATKEP